MEVNLSNLLDSEKWVLSTGKVVDNTLREFNKLCLVDYPSASMIIDLDDNTYAKEEIFTESELNEISLKNRIEFEQSLPKQLADYINRFNCGNIPEVRKQLLLVEEWEKNYSIEESQDLDWVKFTVYAFVRLYESNNLRRKQSEARYNANVWSVIDKSFDNFEEMKAVR